MVAYPLSTSAAAHYQDDAQATQLSSATTPAILQTPIAALVLPLEERYFEQDHNTYPIMADMGA